ncbi:hypothetical protein CSKR_101069 [Clonorchis sinensis]|uniref:Uncharacterized protein n=1 Tax=Clonorchis sinensis TaxID=79923 RepID=A0A419QHW6_CLOSI|nr:hypothetical protein CSKR_101069 [Clonorchis sinensis]
MVVDSRSAVKPLRCRAAIPSKGRTTAGILPSCPSPDRGSREAEVGFESPFIKPSSETERKWLAVKGTWCWPNTGILRHTPKRTITQPRKNLAPISHHFSQCLQKSEGGITKTLSLKVDRTNSTQTLLMRCSRRNFRHSEGAEEKSTRLGRRCVSMHSTWTSHRNQLNWMFSVIEVPAAQPITAFLIASSRIN